MKPLDDEIDRLDAEIARLQVLREGVVRARTILYGGIDSEAPPPQARKRAANVKPIVLDFMAARASSGATSIEVSNHVKENVPTVAKDTVGSLLSRLKGDGALVFDGERYYDVKYGPKGDSRPFEPRVVG